MKEEVSLADELASIGATRLTQESYIVAGFYAQSLGNNAAAENTPFSGILKLRGSSADQDGFDGFTVDGSIVDCFGEGQIEGWTDSLNLRFAKIYSGRKNPAEIVYELQRKGQNLWVGEYNFKDSKAEIKGATTCLLAPVFTEVDFKLL